MINVAINPICAIAGVRNGALVEVPELWHQAIEAMREAEAVAKASGIDLGDSDSESYLRRWSNRLPRIEFLCFRTSWLEEKPR